MPIYLATGATFTVSALVLSPAGTGLTGAASTLKIWIRRTSDGKFLDFADNTFKSSGWTTRQQAMTEADATNAPGLYTYAFNTGSIVSPSADDTYQIELDQVGANTAANVPQYEELLMGRHLDTIAANLNATVSSRAVPGDLMGLVAGAITSAKFATDAIDSNAIAASAASEVASTVWSTAVPGAFASGTSGFVLGTNLNATVSSRAVPGDAMTLTTGERSAVGTAVWATGTRTITGTAAGAITAASFAANALGAVWDELVASHVLAGSFGLLIGTDLDATISSRATNSGAATSVWATVVPGAFLAGQAGHTLGTNLDATVSSRSTLTQAQILSDATPFQGARVDASISSRAVSGDAMTLTAGERSAVGTAVWATATRTITGTGAAALSAASFATDAIDGNAVASSAVSEIQSGLATASGLTSAVSSINAHTDSAVAPLATSANVSAAESAIRGAQSLDLSLIGGAGFNTAVDSLVAAAADRTTFIAALGEVQNSTTFSATIPTLVLPTSGTVAYKIRVNIENTTAVPTDPDANTITVAAQNGAGSDRSANLSSTTMTRLDVGRYEVAYNLSSSAALEQLIFTFSYTQSAVPYAKDRTATVVDSVAADFTASDRANLGAILADTSAMEPTISANLDAAVSSRATNAGAASAAWDEILTGHTIPGSTGAALTASDSPPTPTAIAAAVWGTSEGSGTMGASLAKLRRRQTNKRVLGANGVVTFYDDADLPEATVQLLDVNGAAVVVQPGDPARSSKES